MGPSAIAIVLGWTFGQVEFIRGDANRDCRLEIADAVFTLGYAFLGSQTPQCLDAADTDDDGRITIGDATRTLGYLFLGTQPPAAPFPLTGPDTTADSLGCHQSSLALQFTEDVEGEGSREHVDIFQSSSLEFRTGFSFTAWILLERSNLRGAVFRKQMVGGQHLEVSLRELDGPAPRVRLVAVPHVPQEPRFLSRATVAVGRWVHIACTFGGGAARIYLDGSVDSSMLVPSALTHSDVTAFLGRWDASGGFVGRLDEVSLWTRSIDGEEVRASMLGLRGTENGLVAYFKCDEGQGPNILDLSHHGNHGRLGLTAAADVEDPAWVSGK